MTSISRWSVWRVLALLILPALLTGCGATGEQAFGKNATAEITLESFDVAELDLIVAPLQGAANAPTACSSLNEGFGCIVRYPDIQSTLLSFETNSQASKSPYYVYVVNHSDSDRRFYLQITMDGKIKLERTLVISGQTTLFVARVLRISADLP